MLSVIMTGCGSNSSDDNTPPAPDSNNDQNSPVVPPTGEFSLGPLPENFDSWENINSSDPEFTSLIVLDGEDVANEACSIYVMGMTENEQGLTQWIVRSSFAHDGEGHPFFVVTFPDVAQLTGAGPFNLIGRNVEDPGEIALVWTEKPIEITQLNDVNIKWWHNDHFDVNRCLGLSVRRDSRSGLRLANGLDSIDEINSADTRSVYIKRWVGYDPVKRAFDEEDSCSIFLMAIENTAALGRPRYYLRTSFQHSGVSHPAFIVDLSESVVRVAGEDFLETRIPNDDEQFLRYQVLDDSAIDSLNNVVLRWRHTDHTHDDQCKDLELQTDS